MHKICTISTSNVLEYKIKAPQLDICLTGFLFGYTCPPEKIPTSPGLPGRVDWGHRVGHWAGVTWALSEGLWAVREQPKEGFVFWRRQKRSYLSAKGKQSNVLSCLFNQNEDLEWRQEILNHFPKKLWQKQILSALLVVPSKGYIFRNIPDFVSFIFQKRVNS